MYFSTPGIPGISAWKVSSSNNASDTLLIPPSIVGGTNVGDPKPIIVYERDHLRLRCAATGVPQPAIEWGRKDGRTITTGSWEGMLAGGHSLVIQFCLCHMTCAVAVTLKIEKI